MKYTVRRHGKKYKVYEVENKRYIIILEDKDRANKIVKNLNRGGAFAGNIPKFMTLGVDNG